MVSVLRNGWFWCCLGLLATNVVVAALWWSDHQSRRPTRVVRVTPAELSSCDQPILITFDRAMTAHRSTPLVVTGEEEGLFDAELTDFRIVPHSDLRGFWRSPTTLEIRPRSRFKRATAYELVSSVGMVGQHDGGPDTRI